MVPKNSNKKLRNILVFTDPGLISLSLSLRSLSHPRSQSHTNISYFNFFGNKMSKKYSKINIKRTCFSYKREGTLSFLEHKPSIYIYIFYVLSLTSNWCDFWS